MARREGNLLVSMNFDSLTDVITNLAGALILVVVLVLGLIGPERSPQPAGVAKASQPQRLALVEQLEASLTEMNRTIEGQTDRLEKARSELEKRHKIEGQTDRLEKVRSELEKLRKNAGASGPAYGNKAKSRGVKSPSKPVTQVVYRPPIEELTTLEPVRFFCQDGRVSYLDTDILSKKIDALGASLKAGKEQSTPFEFDLPESDFHIRGRASGRVATFEVARKPGALGEAWDDVHSPDSRFRNQLHETAKRSPRLNFVHFYVWPDSYEVFRRARSLAWDAHYDVGWEPIPAGSPLSLRRQPGRGVYLKSSH